MTLKFLHHNKNVPTESMAGIYSVEHGHRVDINVDKFIQEVIHSKQEVEIARQQFDSVSDPLLIDHIVFRLGAAEKRLNYLFQLARKMDLSIEGIHWGWLDNA